MPRANPKASFDAAARHLLRFLNEPAMLRRNPLVQAVFEDGIGRMARAREEAALASIRRLVEEGAEKSYRLDVAAGKRERAHRQREIVRRAYFERVAAADVASALGLSIRQYRRDRNEIARRIARHVEETRHAVLAPVVVPRFDALRFRMERAEQLMEMGDASGAADVHEGLLREATGAAPKIESSCRLAEAWSDMGDARVANAYLRDSEAVLADDAYELTPIAREAARCDVSFVRSVLAWRDGEIAEADESLAFSMARLEPHLREGGFRIHALFAEVLLEHAQRCADRGGFADATAAVARVTKLLDGVRDASLRQRSDAVRMGAFFAMISPKPSLSPSEAFAPIGEALALARRCGSAKRVILANASLAVLHRYRNEIGLAHSAVVRCVEMLALVPAVRFRARVAPTLAVALSHTRHRKRGADVASECADSLARGSVDWIRARLAVADDGVPLGGAASSYEICARCEEYARAASAPRRRADALRGLALSSHALSRIVEARRHADEALELARSYGTGLSVSYALEAAATIGSGTAFARRRDAGKERRGGCAQADPRGRVASASVFGVRDGSG